MELLPQQEKELERMLGYLFSAYTLSKFSTNSGPIYTLEKSDCVKPSMIASHWLEYCIRIIPIELAKRGFDVGDYSIWLISNCLWAANPVNPITYLSPKFKLYCHERIFTPPRRN